MKAFLDILTFYFVFAIVAVILGNIDFEYSKRFHRSLFVPKLLYSGMYLDGGSSQWHGFGYKIFHHHSLDESFKDIEMLKDKRMYKVGPVLKPISITNIPGIRKLLNREDVAEGYYIENEFKKVSWSDKESELFDIIVGFYFDIYPYVAFLFVYFIYYRIRITIRNSNKVA